MLLSFKQFILEKLDNSIIRLLNKKEALEFLDNTDAADKPKNDNLEKSLTAMDKFGMSHYDELPINVINACKNAGLTYNNRYVNIQGFGTKNYIIENTIFNVIVGMYKNTPFDKDSKFDSTSRICLAVENIKEFMFIFLIFDYKYTPKNILFFLNNIQNIIKQISIIYNEIDTVYDKISYTSKLEELLKNNNIDTKQVFFNFN